MTIQLSPRMEDYLETILDLEQDNNIPRVKDIAERMGVSKPTVTAALKTLSDAGLIRHESYGYVELTKTGRKAGTEVHNRHKLLKDFFVNVLGIDPEKAGEDACNAEHHISDVTLHKLTRFIEFIEQCPRSGESWLQHFRCWCDKIDEPESATCQIDCRQKCIEEFGDRINGVQCMNGNKD